MIFFEVSRKTTLDYQQKRIRGIGVHIKLPLIPNKTITHVRLICDLNKCNFDVRVTLFRDDISRFIEIVFETV